jgi:hypothetical protein
VVKVTACAESIQIGMPLLPPSPARVDRAVTERRPTAKWPDSGTERRATTCPVALGTLSARSLTYFEWLADHVP